MVGRSPALYMQRAWLSPTYAQVFYGFAIPPTAESLPSDNLTILQCTEDEVTIEWSIQNDLKFVAFEYSCIHPTNSALVSTVLLIITAKACMHVKYCMIFNL